VKSYDVPAIVVSDPSENITDLLANRVIETPQLPIFSRETSEGQWKDLTAKDFEDQVIALAKGLIASGVAAGQAVAIMSRTRFEWTLLDFAIWYTGAVGVPIYETSAPSQMEWILADSDAVALFVETAEHIERFEQIKAGAPLVRNVYSFDSGAIEKLIQMRSSRIAVTRQS
jgi:long-chain acyl-CoA synthetase